MKNGALEQAASSNHPTAVNFISYDSINSTFLKSTRRLPLELHHTPGPDCPLCIDVTITNRLANLPLSFLAFPFPSFPFFLSFLMAFVLMDPDTVAETALGYFRPVWPLLLLLLLLLLGCSVAPAAGQVQYTTSHSVGCTCCYYLVEATAIKIYKTKEAVSCSYTLYTFSGAKLARTSNKKYQRDLEPSSVICLLDSLSLLPEGLCFK